MHVAVYASPWQTVVIAFFWLAIFEHQQLPTKPVALKPCQFQCCECCNSKWPRPGPTCRGNLQTYLNPEALLSFQGSRQLRDTHVGLDLNSRYPRPLQLHSTHSRTGGARRCEGDREGHEER